MKLQDFKAGDKVYAYLSSKLEDVNSWFSFDITNHFIEIKIIEQRSQATIVAWEDKRFRPDFKNINAVHLFSDKKCFT